MNVDQTNESDDEWAARTSRAVRAGSRDALAEIFDRCAQRVVDDIRSLTRRDESFALDCLQEMFVKFATHPPVVESYAQLFAWMRSVALNIARNSILAEQRRENREAIHAMVEIDTRDARSSVDLGEIEAQLTNDERVLLDLRFGRGLKISAIASALSMGSARVESAIRRAVARLRRNGADS